nr:MAG TPA: hypothetical protein [Caudoviricetes sp.]
MPKVVNIQGLQDLALIGNIKAESLPNITGKFHITKAGISQDTEGAFTSYDYGSRNSASTANTGSMIEFDASRSSSVYQNNAPVQQEAIQYPYFIQVATGVEESIDVTREIELNNPFSLLDYKWSEYEITNASWLLSNGAFHSGATYVSVYNLLLEIYNGTTIKDGVSVKLATEEYTDTDFVLNTSDTTFRLPIKVKLASGNAVIGNGMTLGLTDGTNNSGTRFTEAGGYNMITPSSNTYGVNVGTNGATGSNLAANTSLGITTDPTKSGIETSSNGLKLYFYVGETIQDANVIVASNVLTNTVMKNSSADKETVVGWSMPDYSAAVAITFTVNEAWTAPCKCRVMGRCYGSGSPAIYGYINGSIPAGATAPMTNGQTHFSFDLDKGDTYTPNVVVGSQETYYIPLKGVN